RCCPKGESPLGCPSWSGSSYRSTRRLSPRSSCSACWCTKSRDPFSPKWPSRRLGRSAEWIERGTVLAANLQLFRSRKDQLWPGNRAEEDGEHGTQRRTLLGPFCCRGHKQESSIISLPAWRIWCLKGQTGPKQGGGETMAATGSNLSVEMQERMEAQLLAVPEGKVTTAASPIDNPDAAYLAATT